MDEKRIKSCLAGNRSAQKELYERYKVNMYVLCQRYFFDQEESKDALQEGFINVYRALYQYDSSRGSLGSWMKRVFINTCLEKLRKKRIDFQSLEYASETIGYESNIISNLSVKDLVQLIRKLPIGYRTVFNLYAIEGYSHREIAEQLNISESTSKTQLMKAKNLLKEKIEMILK